MVKKPPSNKAGSKPRPSKQQPAKRTTSQPSHHQSAQQQQQPDLRPADKAHQQKLLNIFQSTFNTVLTSGTFHTLLQEVKTALFNRDFEAAFGREDYLEAYAARWSPTRALCYASVLEGIKPYLDDMTASSERALEGGDGAVAGDAGEEQSSKNHDEVKSDDHEPRIPSASSLKVLAIGGAAAELVAFGSHLSQPSSSSLPSQNVSGAITLLDIAPWANVVDKLRTSLTTPPTLSKYASAAAQAINAPLVAPDRLQSATFEQHDALALGKEELASIIMSLTSASASSPLSPTESSPSQQEEKEKQQPILVTLLFTLNELFTASGIGKTTTFLLNLTAVLPPGSLLLVVDSPGSYSETTLGQEAKRYPMQWLLDRVLLLKGTGDSRESQMWNKIETRESVWFRLSTELRYSIPLEDMRYQMHLYRRGAGAVGGE